MRIVVVGYAIDVSVIEISPGGTRLHQKRHPFPLFYLNCQPLEVVSDATAILNFNWLKITHIEFYTKHLQILMFKHSFDSQQL